MNTTSNQEFVWKAQATGVGIDCATGKKEALPRTRRIQPGQTVVLFDPGN